MEDKWYILREDKISVFRKLGREGKAGDHIKIVYYSPPACIVENEKGYRFATQLDNLIDVVDYIIPMIKSLPKFTQGIQLTLL